MRRWDTRFIRDFMLVLGPVSSAFDFLRFCAILLGLVLRYLIAAEIAKRRFYARVAGERAD